VRNQNISRKRKTAAKSYDTRYKENSALANPYAMFIYALTSPLTRERYSTRLR
jgi:hypothetical protein